MNRANRTDASDHLSPATFTAERQGSGSFADSIAYAVAAGQTRAAGLQAEFDVIGVELTSACERVSPFVRAPTDDQSEVPDNASALVALTQRRGVEIEDLFKRQTASLTHVNLVFFGRTGAGKSSLIEALTHGDGGSVSHGESDWTVSVRPVKWNGCRLLDTPGINGWSRTQSRGELEQRARAAVEIADIVLLCFDSQSQQEAEFARVADWIKAYGKPAIAVLNIRNQHWRFPPRVGEAAQRRNLSRAVHQHRGNIRDGLTELGLIGIPIVCISAKRALMARGREPFEGPDARTFVIQRNDYGTETLLAWSNLPALESLIVEALRMDAPAIRLGMLVAQLRGVVAGLDGDLDRIAADADAAAVILDDQIENLLKVLGYPPADDPALDQASRHLAWLLRQVEVLRGGQFSGRSTGEFQIFCGQTSKAYFGKLRSEALGRTDEFILEAFAAGTAQDGAAFAESVYQRVAVEQAGTAVLEATVLFLRRKIHLVTQDAATKFEFLIHAADATEGSAGRGWRWAGVASRVGGILMNVALPAGVLLGWTPIGWAVAIAGGVVGLTAWFLQWLGEKAEQKGESARNKERQKALRAARRHVQQAFDKFERRIQEAAATMGRSARATTLIPCLQEALAARTVTAAAADVKAKLASLISSLEIAHPQGVIDEAARAIERRRYPDRAQAGALIWAGDAWITDPVGRVANSDYDPPPAPLPAASAVDLSGMRAVFTPLCPAPGAARPWAREARRLAAHFPDAPDVAGSLTRLVGMDRPSLVLLGDYNTGKTSFIKRLMVEAGKPVPSKALVRANPTTSTVLSYKWDHLTLVDTPGLHSARPGDTDYAIDAISRASFLICLLQPNILGKTLDVLCPVLLGETTKGLVPMLERTLLVINRCDELGPDPDVDRDEYERACHRKRLELKLALAARGIDFAEGQIVCVASDPYGRTGNRRDVTSQWFDSGRHWDGMDGLIGTLRSIDAPSLRTGIDATILGTGLALLSRLRHSTVEAVAEISQETQLLAQTERLLLTAAGDSRRLQAAIEARLDNILDEATQGHLGGLMGTTDETKLHAAATALATWWQDAEFQDAIETWESESQNEIAGWFTAIAEEIGRQLNSAAFAKTSLSTNANFDPNSLAPKANRGRSLLQIIGDTLKSSGQRDVVYDIGKMLSVNFRPYGAIKAAKVVSKLGFAVAFIGATLDIWSWVSAAKVADSREAARNEAAEYLRKSKAGIRGSLLQDESGLCFYLAQQSAELRRHGDRLRTEATAAASRQSGLSEKVAALDGMLAAGWAALAIPRTSDIQI